MIEFIKNFFEKRRRRKELEEILNQTNSSNDVHIAEFLQWLTSDQPSVFFRLKDEEISFFVEGYLTPWEEDEFDDSFKDWPDQTEFNELNFLIRCFKGENGLCKAQDAYDYICKIFPALADYHEQDDF